MLYIILRLYPLEFPNKWLRYIHFAGTSYESLKITLFTLVEYSNVFTDYVQENLGSSMKTI